MRFFDLTKTGLCPNKEQLKNEYQNSHHIGVVSVGDSCLFVKKGFKQYFIPYTHLSRAFRRVMLVPAKMCCATGELEVESVVLCTKTASESTKPVSDTTGALAASLSQTTPNTEDSEPTEIEVAQFTLPGKKAALMLIEEIKAKSPDTVLECPEKNPPKKLSKNQQKKRAKAQANKSKAKSK